MKKQLQILLLSLCLTIAACTPDAECRTESNIGAVVLFSLDTLQGDTMMVTLSTIDSLTVQGVGNDSVLYDGAKSVSSLFLPLRADANTTTYALSAYNRTDTLYVTHDNEVNFISLACGCFVYYSITKVDFRGGLIDSVSILNSSVESYKQDNIRLYMSLR